MTNSNLIELRDMSFCWAEQSAPVLSIKAFSVESHQHVFVRGDSGSGKTTLLNLLCGIYTATTGSVEVLSHELGALSNQQRDRFRGDHLGVIFQQFNLLPFLSVRDNIVLPSHFSLKRRRNLSDADHEVERLLQALDLPVEIADKSIAELSVGQQQRVAVCRALLGSPELIIADEPTSALDTNNRDRFLQLLFQEADKHGSTIVFVSHDQTIASEFNHIVELSEINQGFLG